MRLQKVLLFIIILPLTLVLDLLMFAFTRNCPTCGSFSQFLLSEGALSFPIVVGLLEWFRSIRLLK